MVKVCVVGPKKSGKTAVVGAFFGGTWDPDRRYFPTVGVRIQEIQRDLPNRKKVNVEFWDCSGDPRLELYLPALSNNIGGLLMIYNTSFPKQKQELERWYHDFAVAKKLPNSSCQIIGINVDNTKSSVMEGKLAALPHMVVSMKEPTSVEHLFKALDQLLIASI